MPFVPMVAMGSIVFCLINLLKNLTNKNWNPVVTQLIAWVAGVVVVMLFAQTDWAETLTFGDRSLASLNGSSLFVIGLMASSILGVVNEVKKALDDHDSAVQPPLIPPSS